MQKYAQEFWTGESSNFYQGKLPDPEFTNTKNICIYTYICQVSTVREGREVNSVVRNTINDWGE